MRTRVQSIRTYWFCSCCTVQYLLFFLRDWYLYYYLVCICVSRSENKYLKNLLQGTHTHIEAKIVNIRQKSSQNVTLQCFRLEAKFQAKFCLIAKIMWTFSSVLLDIFYFRLNRHSIANFQLPVLLLGFCLRIQWTAISLRVIKQN